MFLYLFLPLPRITFFLSLGYQSSIQNQLLVMLFLDHYSCATATMCIYLYYHTHMRVPIHSSHHLEVSCLADSDILKVILFMFKFSVSSPVPGTSSSLMSIYYKIFFLNIYLSKMIWSEIGNFTDLLSMVYKSLSHLATHIHIFPLC